VCGVRVWCVWGVVCVGGGCVWGWGVGGGVVWGGGGGVRFLRTVSKIVLGDTVCSSLRWLIEGASI